MEKILIKEKCRIPGTDVILEKGDELLLEDVCFEMANIKKKRSKLPVDIWVDDTGNSYQHSSARIKFANQKGITANSRNMVPMSISDSPEILISNLSSIKLSQNDINEIKLFVKNNKDNLLRLADPNDEYDIADFLNDMHLN